MGFGSVVGLLSSPLVVITVLTGFSSVMVVEVVVASTGFSSETTAGIAILVVSTVLEEVLGTTVKLDGAVDGSSSSLLVLDSSSSLSSPSSSSSSLALSLALESSLSLESLESLESLVSLESQNH